MNAHRKHPQEDSNLQDLSVHGFVGHCLIQLDYGGKTSTPGGIRTPNHVVRSHRSYSVRRRVHTEELVRPTGLLCTPARKLCRLTSLSVGLPERPGFHTSSMNLNSEMSGLFTVDGNMKASHHGVAQMRTLSLEFSQLCRTAHRDHFQVVAHLFEERPEWNRRELNPQPFACEADALTQL